MGFMMLMLIDFADVIIAGLISEEDFAVLGYCYPLIYLMIAIGFGFNQGVTIVGSATYQKEGAIGLNRLIVQACMVALVVSLCLCTLVIIGLHQVWVSDEILAYYSILEPYLLWVLGALLPTFFLLVFCAVCQILGKPNIIRNALALMLVTTMITHPCMALNTGYVMFSWPFKVTLPIGLNLGLVGIAISKIIVSCMGLIYVIFKVVQWQDISAQVFKVRLPIMSSFLRHALPASGIQLLVPAYFLVLMQVVANFGLEAISGFSLGYRIVMVVVVPILGVFVALMVVLTHDLALKQFDKVKYMLKLCLQWGSVVVGITMVLAYVLAEFLLPESNMEAIKVIALQYMLLAIYITVLEYMIGVCTVAFQSIQKPLLAFFVQSSRTLIFPLPILWFVSQNALSLLELWYGLALSFSLAALLTALLTQKYFWRASMFQD
nr:MATE family efflux transporter [Candidatus Synchoanobacter obligatus]